MVVYYIHIDIEGSKLSSYKSLITIEENEIENIAPRQALDLLKMQENDLSFFLKTHVLVNADNIFYTFYKNICQFVGKDIHSYNESLATPADYTKDEFYNSGVGFNNISVNDRIKPILAKPDIKFITMEYLDDGVWVPAIDYNYLYETYSARLSKPWQQYLMLMSKEKSAQNDNFYYRKSKPTISKDKIAKKIINERKFIERNPKFVLNSKINENLKLLVEDLLSDDESTFQYDDKGNMIVKKDVKLAYESFLSNSNKAWTEYKTVHNWYEMLKSYDFIRPVTGLTKPDTKNIIYKDVYLTQQLEEVEVFTARVKNIVKTKDIKMLADNVFYPISIEFADGDIMNISDKNQLLKLGRDKIFTNELVLNIASSKKALPSVKGFTVGNPQEITFDFVQDGSLMITKINLKSFSKSRVIEVE